MTDKETCEEIKREILRRAHVARACKEQYRRAYESETMAELCQVIKDNFWWACWHQVIDTALLKQYESDFAENDIYVNVSVCKGYLLCDNTTVEACGNATVVAYGNATVEAYGNATVTADNNAMVEAYDNATVVASGNATVEAYSNATVGAYDITTVRAYGNATVEACDNAYCTSFDKMQVALSGNAIYRVRSTDTVYYANTDLKFVKQ